ncbi:hypothetical protein Ae201684_006060 [Aphanomyces euteiches]|uniref:Uncharacterized protein n=1 Tax=Aphanomyces euteiches TaxID=100861 RepID=A0A6G0XDI9_9STRA|nr:hypothetical protein Ae201684_006060 [Aphanomyces euteiches]
MAHMIEEMYDQVVQKQCKRYVPSGKVFFIHVEPCSAAGEYTAIEGFNWRNVCDESGKNIALNEDQQRERYGRKYRRCAHDDQALGALMACSSNDIEAKIPEPMRPRISHFVIQNLVPQSNASKGVVVDQS